MLQTNIFVSILYLRNECQNIRNEQWKNRRITRLLFFIGVKLNYIILQIIQVIQNIGYKIILIILIEQIILEVLIIL